MTLSENYKSSQNQWERYSSIRTRPRRVITSEDNKGYYFPPIRQPILLHPKLKNITEEQKKYILCQSLFKYMNDVISAEDIVNRVARGIIQDKYNFIFSKHFKLDAFTIIIDETYHSYAALDFMHQISNHENIEVLPLPKDTEISSALKILPLHLTDEQKISFELIAVAISEHALTADLMEVAKSKDVCKIFYYLMHDHVLDENRHAKYFKKVLEIFWNALSKKDQNDIAPLIPKLINLYFAPENQKSFDRLILQQIFTDSDEIEKILDDTHFGWSASKINQSNIIVMQMIELLQKSGVMEHPLVTNGFHKFGITNPN